MLNQKPVYSPGQLRQIQRIELDALKELLRVCKAVEAPCFLIGGSALGVVRHGGFIPWDDDVDVGMLRADYERFLRLAPEALKPGYTLQTPYNGPRNPYFYSKLRVDGTRFVEYCNHTNRVMHQGVYIDIFPYDEVPDDEAENLRHFRRCQRLVRLFTFRESRDVSQPPAGAGERVRAVLRRGLHYGLRLCTSRRRMIEKTDRVITAWNGTGQSALACLNFPRRKCEYARREDLLPLGEGSFEGLTVPVPHNCDVYLTTHYGDYMVPPPEAERVSHLPYEVELPQQTV